MPRAVGIETRDLKTAGQAAWLGVHVDVRRQLPFDGSHWMVVIVVQYDDVVVYGVDFGRAVGVGGAFPVLLHVVETVAATDEGVPVHHQLASAPHRGPVED